jgi:hypothetical protein
LARPLQVTERPPEEALILALDLDHVPLEESFPAYRTPDGYLVPFGELCRELELGIEVDSARGTADGFIIQESRRFHLDLQMGTITVAGHTDGLEPVAVEWHRDDIYVDSRLLAKWLPVDLEVDFRRLRITVVPREVLPIEQRWSREGLDTARLQQPKRRIFEHLDIPYVAVEVPMVDQTLLFGTYAKPSGLPPLLAQSSTLAGADLAYMSGQFYNFTDSQGGAHSSWLTLGRQDPRAGLLGPLRATQVAFGQVADQGVDLVTQAQSGTGAMASNLPLDRSSSPNLHSFQGSLPPGWDVELYRNDTLLAFQTSRSDGLYQFLNIPLLFGLNRFVLVFYGPQGQRREETALYDTSMSQLHAGDLEYQVAALRPTLLGDRAHAQGRYGISSQADGSFGLARMNLDGTVHEYAQAGLDGYWRLGSGSVSVARDSAGGSVLGLGVHSRLAGVDLNLRRAFLGGGFESEVFQDSVGFVSSRTQVDLATQVPLPDHSHLDLTLNDTRDSLSGGRSQGTFQAGVGTTIGKVYLGNYLNRSVIVETGFNSTYTLGTFLASGRVGESLLQGQVIYQASGTTKLDSLDLQGYFHLNPAYLLRPEITLSPPIGDKAVHLDLEKHGGRLGFGVDLGYSTLYRASLEVTMRVGLTREPREGTLHTHGDLGISATGAVSLLVYQDLGESGARTPSDPVLAGVRVRVNGVERPEATDANGVLFLDGLPANQDLDLEIVPASLKDPLMRSERPGIRLTPRAGHVAQVDIPVVIHGEMSGTVYERRQGTLRPLPGLRLELVDDGNRVARSVRTEFDGFYVMSDIVPGVYRLLVTAEAAARYGLKPPPPKEVRFERSGTVLDDVDLVLDPLEPETPEEPPALAETPQAQTPAPTPAIQQEPAPAGAAGAAQPGPQRHSRTPHRHHGRKRSTRKHRAHPVQSIPAPRSAEDPWIDAGTLSLPPAQEPARPSAPAVADTGPTHQNADLDQD